MGVHDRHLLAQLLELGISALELIIAQRELLLRLRQLGQQPLV
jgi:hypothetical protein